MSYGSMSCSRSLTCEDRFVSNESLLLPLIAVTSVVIGIAVRVAASRQAARADRLLAPAQTARNSRTIGSDSSKESGPKQIYVRRTLRYGAVEYGYDGQFSFIDYPGALRINPMREMPDEEVLAVLKFARIKFGPAHNLSGDEAFQRRAMGLIIKHQLDIRPKNPKQRAVMEEMLTARQANEEVQ